MQQSAAAGGRVTYRHVFAVREFTALTAALVLSVVGDQFARVAVSVLVYRRTGSPLLTAVAFGISFLPWALGGPLLAAAADRLPRRTVLIVCDVARAVLVAALVLPGMPLIGLLLLLLAAEMFSPPATAARSALVPDILTGEQYVLGTSVSTMILQLGQVVGFAVGGALVALLQISGALLLDAATFILSAALIAIFLRARPAADTPTEAGHVVESLGAGLRLVLGDRLLLSYVSLAWLVPLFVTGAEGIMAPYARHLGGGSTTVGLLLAAGPLGTTVAMVVLGRFVTTERRERLVRPLAVLACALLVPLLLDPPLPVVLALLALSGAAMSYNLPLNAMFVQAVPAALRGRAFGVAATGLYLTQGVGVLLCGAATATVPAPMVIAVSGGLGVLCLLPIVLTRHAAAEGGGRAGSPLQPQPAAGSREDFAAIMPDEPTVRETQQRG